MIRPDGGDLRLVLDLPGTSWAHEPAWSPDGSMLAYMLSQPATDGDIPGLQTSVICGLERATGAGRLLLRGSTSTEALEEPAWTPDGQSLVVTRRQTTADPETGSITSTVALVRYNLAAGTPLVLVEGASSPAISPDGERLAYIRYDQQTEDVVLVLARADGMEGRLIAETQPPLGVFVAPRWSPDGAVLLFAASRGPAAAGASPIGWRAVVDTLLGAEVAHAHGDPAALWIVDRDGQNLRALTEANLDDPRAAWAPDGASIAVVAGSGSGVSLLDVNTREVRQLTTEGDYGGISWAPTTQKP
jgi:Tol biopolymer transport system component